MNRVSHSTACHGISLIETLLALVLSSIISILVVQSFSQSKFLYLDGESRARARERPLCDAVINQSHSLC